MKTKNNFNRFRLLNFLIGLSLAILSAVFAFNWTVIPVKYISTSEIEKDTELQVLRTYQEPEKIKLPPLSVTVSEKISPEEIFEIVNEPPPVFVDTAIAKTTLSDASSMKTFPIDTVVKNNIPIIEKEPEIDVPFIIVEEMPRFPGCEDAGTKKEKQICSERKMLEFIGKRIHYPEIALQNGIEGKVTIQFIVEKDGSITNMKIRRDIGGGCGKEALKIAKQMPTWIPGKQRGRPVRVIFNLPVVFKTK